MSDFTPRANLRLPGGGSTGTILPDEQVDIDVLNDNFRKIDALLGARNIPSVSSYAGSMDGDLVYARDTEYLQMYSATDGRLVTPRHPGAHFYTGTIAQRDAATTSGVIRDGDHWQVTGEANDNSEYVRLGGAWVYARDTEIPLSTVLTAASGRTITGRAFVKPGTVQLMLNVAGHVDNTKIGNLLTGYRPTTLWFSPINGGNGPGQVRFSTAGEIWGFATTGTIQISTTFPRP